MGSAERRARELEARKADILEVSKELFFQHGYEGVSVKNICDAAEYGKSSIYALFKSKEDIYAHINLEGLTILADMMQKIEDRDLEKELLLCSETYFEFFLNYRSFYLALFYFANKQPIRDQLSQELIQALEFQRQRITEEIKDLFQRGMEEKVFRKLDVEQTNLLFWSGLSGIISNYSYLSPEEVPVENLRENCRQFAFLFLNGVKK